MADSFRTKKELRVGSETYFIASLVELEKKFPEVSRLPFSLKVLLENLLRHEGPMVDAADVEKLARVDVTKIPTDEIAFTPARVLLQDFTGVPAIVDLAAMRAAMKALGGDPRKINPLQPVELVIDHSVQVDAFGTSLAKKTNTDLEYERNRERYEFLKWGQKAFSNFRVVPPGTGIVHQVNVEHLARVVMTQSGWAYPDTLVGTDSHTTMVNGLGVLGWGVGGIEAEAAMLGQPVSMLIPEVIGVRLTGMLPEGATATDLVLTVTEMLRKRGVVGKFVEFFGSGLLHLPLSDRATIANMAPEYGATCGIFPIDDETLRYLRESGRSEASVKLVEAYAKAQGIFVTPDSKEATYTDVLSLDLGSISACLAGPSRPQDRVVLSRVPESFRAALPSLMSKAPAKTEKPVAKLDAGEFALSHGAVVLAAITSCTNTSNPSVLMAAGLLAKNAVSRGLTTKPWVKTSLAPGSQVVPTYLEKAGLLASLEALRFHVVGFGCTTCIGNSGPLPDPVSKAIEEGALTVCSVLSGNRNFEGRVHAEVRANYLASPPLVVAYALSGRIDIDFATEPLGHDKSGAPVLLKDIWPSSKEVASLVDAHVKRDTFEKVYASVFDGDERWKALPVREGDLYAWDEKSTYVRHPPYFANMGKTASPVSDVTGARVLLVLGDSITTDHISPAGSIKKVSPAGAYLLDKGAQVSDFNSYGARRGNHEVMVRGTFANTRLRNALAGGAEGGVTRHLPSGETMSVFDAAMRYEKEGVPLVILAGKEYGSGSSRDWAGKGPRLLGVRVVIAESYERIHRSNLVGMGVLPLEFLPGESARTHGFTGEEIFRFAGLSALLDAHKTGARTLRVEATRPGGEKVAFDTRVRIDTPGEVQYFRNGGILPYVLRQLVSA